MINNNSAIKKSMTITDINELATVPVIFTEDGKLLDFIMKSEVGRWTGVLDIEAFKTGDINNKIVMFEKVFKSIRLYGNMEYMKTCKITLS